jgi:tetratricopeptide (TPR) repeat protein
VSAENFEHLLSLDNPAAGPALPIDAAAADRLVEAALAEALPGEGGAGGEGAAVGAKVTSGVSHGALAKVFAVSASVVVAATLWGTRAKPVAVVDEVHRLAPAGEAEPAAARPEPVAERATVVVVDAGAVAQASRGARMPGAVAMPEVVLSDLELLGAANAARRERKWREADALYGKVVDRFPASSISAVAALASGELRLDLLGDAEGARERFRFATTRGDAHALDAYEGLLKACLALHDRRCEEEARTALDARGVTTTKKNENP